MSTFFISAQKYHKKNAYIKISESFTINIKIYFEHKTKIFLSNSAQHYICAWKMPSTL